MTQTTRRTLIDGLIFAALLYGGGLGGVLFAHAAHAAHAAPAAPASPTDTVRPGRQRAVLRV